jgi:asparagine synthase (glutamine-hydrolysing)
MGHGLKQQSSTLTDGPNTSLTFASVYQLIEGSIVCGIAGIVGYEHAQLNSMLARLQHRGPDHSGTVAVPGTRCSLGHARLSIIDLDPRSHQPFFSPCGRYIIVFNGEIYNFEELRIELERSEERFRTTSDTEVLLQWLIKHGASGLNQLDGMYAFGLVDTKARTLLLARDSIGEKPLYYSAGLIDGEPRFAFASEIKSLLSLPNIDRSLDQNALLDFLRFLYTAPPHTFYQGIKELPPGHCLHVDLNTGIAQTPHAFYSLEKSIEYDEAATAQSAARKFRTLFERSVELRLISDVNIGIFLSAGIDSNAILAAAQDSTRLGALHTYTLQYSKAHDESQIARRIASTYGLPNLTIPFHELEFHSSVKRMVDIFDQPFGNSTALVSDLIARQASQRCKVCLIGDGGDELAIGYPRYRAILHHQKMERLPPALKGIIKLACSWVPERGEHAVSIRRAKQFLRTLGQPLAESFIDWSTYINTSTLAWATGVRDCKTPFYDDLTATFRRHASDPVRAAAIVDMKSFVPFNLLQSADRTSMAHSLELRSPFLSPLLVQGILGLPSHVKMGSGVKPLITGAFADRLPASILNQPKRPFNPPIQELLRTNLDHLRNYLLHSSACIGTVLDRDFLRKEVAAFASSKRDNSTLLWGLATLENWLQRGS